MSTSTDLTLAIEDLTVSFDGFKAVDDLNLYIDKNELHVVIGPNGAGKTTVLDLICGKTKASSGSIKFLNKELTALAEHEIVRSGVGRKFQTPSIYENLTVFENLEVSYPYGRSVLGSLFFKRDQKVIDKIHEIAKEIMLDDALDTESALLSHGQKQWLEIGMLLAQNPRILLIDEPAAGMSDEETERTGELLLSLEKKHSLIVIEHDMEFIRQIARKVTVLHQGHILKEGSFVSVKSDPEVIEVYLGRQGKKSTQI